MGKAESVNDGVNLPKGKSVPDGHALDGIYSRDGIVTLKGTRKSDLDGELTLLLEPNPVGSSTDAPVTKVQAEWSKRLPPEELARILSSLANAWPIQPRSQEYVDRDFSFRRGASHKNGLGEISPDITRNRVPELLKSKFPLSSRKT